MYTCHRNVFPVLVCHTFHRMVPECAGRVSGIQDTNAIQPGHTRCKQVGRADPIRSSSVDGNDMTRVSFSQNQEVCWLTEVLHDLNSSRGQNNDHDRGED
jgi:hypothetical protein